MGITNDDTAATIDPGSPFLTFSSGAVLTPSAGVITPTASHHHVAAGTIATIATTSIATNGEALLLLTADGAITITLGATIVGRTTALATDDQILYELDGGSKWREVAVNRSLASGDIPNLAASKITSGQLALARGGTNADLSATGGTSQFLKQVSTGAVVTVVRPSFADLSDFTEWTSFTPARTAATGTWTVGTEVGRYKLSGKTMHIQYSVVGSTLSGTAFISFTIPASKLSAQPLREIVWVTDNGTNKAGLMAINSSSSVLTFYTSVGFAAWAGGTTNNDVYIDVAFEIQ